MPLTDQQRIAKHKDFLSANWERIATFAWENHLAKGRGAVLVPEEEFVHATTPHFKGLRFNYVPVADKDKNPFKGILSEKELRWLDENEPDGKVVLCIMRDSGISSYLIGGRLKPSECYAKQKAKGN